MTLTTSSDYIILTTSSDYITLRFVAWRRVASLRYTAPRHEPQFFARLVRNNIAVNQSFILLVLCRWTLFDFVVFPSSKASNVVNLSMPSHHHHSYICSWRIWRVLHEYTSVAVYIWLHSATIYSSAEYSIDTTYIINIRKPVVNAVSIHLKAKRLRRPHLLCAWLIQRQHINVSHVR